MFVIWDAIHFIILVILSFLFWELQVVSTTVGTIVFVFIASSIISYIKWKIFENLEKLSYEEDIERVLGGSINQKKHKTNFDPETEFETYYRHCLDYFQHIEEFKAEKQKRLEVRDFVDEELQLRRLIEENGEFFYLSDALMPISEEDSRKIKGIIHKDFFSESEYKRNRIINRHRSVLFDELGNYKYRKIIEMNH